MNVDNDLIQDELNELLFTVMVFIDNFVIAL